MAHYIFIRGKRPGSWELLEKVERADLAVEVFRNYQTRLSGRNQEIVAMVEAHNVFEGQAKLSKQPEGSLTLCKTYSSAPKPWQHNCGS